MQVDNVESFTLNTNVHVNPIIICTAQRHKTKTLQFTASNINMQCECDFKLLISIKSKFLRAHY